MYFTDMVYHCTARSGTTILAIPRVMALLSITAAKRLFRWTDAVVKPDEQFADQPTGTQLEIIK
jgi:hypothetical protein